MANRNRRDNKAANAAAIQTLQVTEIERVFLSWMLGQISGLDKEGSRKVGRIIDAFDLENFDGIEADQRNDAYEYELSGYEIRFLVEEIDRLFDGKKVTPAHAKPAIRFYDRLKEALDNPEVPEKPASA